MPNKRPLELPKSQMFLLLSRNFNPRHLTYKPVLFIRRSAECLDLLIASGADVNVADIHGRLPLHYAAAKSWFNCMFTLVSRGERISSC